MRSTLWLALIFVCFLISETQAQCSGINRIQCSTAAPTVVGNSISCTPPANQGGRRNFEVTNMIAGATYRLSNCGSGFDTQMTVRDASGTFVAFNDDNGPACTGTAASIDFTPTTTGDYRIHLNRYNCATTNNLNGDIVVTLLSTSSGPANDDCGTATSLSVSPTSTCVTLTAGDSSTATESISAISCGGFTGNSDDDVWYSFVATATNHDITARPGTLSDLVVDLRSGACDGTNIDCADNTTGANDEVINATGLSIGTTYYVRVYSYGGAANAGTFDICVTTPIVIPSNDDCANAIALGVSPTDTCVTSASGTTENATQSIAAINCGGTTGDADDDVWYSFVATAFEHDITVTPGTLSNAVIDLRSGACTGTNIDCADITGGTSSEVINATGLTLGATYYVRVYSRGSNTSQQGTFDICVTTPPQPPLNDDCSNATALTVSGTTCTTSVSGTTELATQSIAAISCNAATGDANDDVWYSFTATAANHDITVTSGTLTNAVIDLRSGACTGTNIDCADATTGTNNEVLNATGLSIGTTYYVRVYSFGSTGNEGTFDICVTTPIVPPANDDCTNATLLGVSPSNTCVTSVSGTTVDATQSIAAISCNGFTGNADDDVWYSFIATATSHDITVTPGTLSDAVLDLRSGACNGTNITCADNTTGSNAEVINATGLSIGTTYYVRVYSYGGTGNGTFDICVTTPVIIPGPCQPTTDTPGTMYIDEVAFLGTLEDVTNAGSGFSTGYQDFTGLSTISRQVEGEGINVYVEAPFRCTWKAWVDWNQDDVFDETTEEVYNSNFISTTTTTFGFVIPLGTTPGDYRIRIRNYTGFDYSLFDYNNSYDFDPCEDFNDTGTTIDELGEAEDYLFTVEPFCDALIDTITDGETCGTGTVDLSVTGTGTPSVTEYRWYDAETGGSLVATTLTGDWTTPSLSATTTYYVTAYNGTCESWVREPIVAKFNPIPTVTITPDVSNRVVCGENDMLEISVSGDVEDVFLIDEDFESGGLGAFSNVIIIDNGATINARSAWQNQTSTFVPAEEVWFPAISSGFGSDQFVICNSDVGADGFGTSYITHNALQSTASYDTTDYVNLTLSFDCYYSHYLDDGTGGADDYFTVEVSTDGTNWTALTADIIADVGIGTKFDNLSYDLSTYINELTLSVRIRFYAVWSDGVAVDNVQLFGDKDVTAVDWTTTPANIIDLYIDTDNDNIGDTPYVSGSYETVYAMPTLAQLEEADYSFTIDANLANGCGAVSSNFNVTNNTRVFDSAADAWGTAANWAQNIVPTSDDCVIIKDNGLMVDTQATGNGLARNITVKNGGYLELATGSSITVTDWINVESGGTLHVRDGANLIQVTDVTSNNNTGEIEMDRTAVGVNTLDYIYWSSPVEDFEVTDVSPGTSPGLIFQWQPTVAGNGLGNYGEWQSASGTMGIGNGYIIRGISGTSIANTAEFGGVPNNGIINTTVTRGTYTGVDYPGAGGTNATNLDDNWNLVGNPYPSAISADAFIAANASVITDDTNPSTITGTVYLWRHLSTPSNAYGDPFYSDYLYNYNENDYIQYNSTGSNPVGFNGNIAAGQAFFVLMDDAAPASSMIQFNNSMRGVAYTNDQFYRSSDDEVGQFENNSESTTTIEKHRIWLDIISPDNSAASSLIGYITGASNEQDRLFDGNNLSDAPTHIYSLIGEEKMAIQGRAVPFDQQDEVPLGVKIAQSGNYTIAINALDGLFETTDQKIYLEDLYTDMIHDLKLTPYDFYSEGGDFEDRFILKYVKTNDNTLDLEEFNSNTGIVITTNENQIKVHAYNSQIEAITIHDILGKRLLDRKNISEEVYDITNLKPTNSTLIVKVVLENGKQKIQKVIY
ncbi:GEVED domain-containing protein [uncultured Kordia sp.]|uniref:GEVED domain-containing protein n=1 Tax=uncultured Kordia sp. TaxID=507699 RepID=UPI002620754C|nr:GEVED domain-containing protein [uncultured Kordia sp.]